MKKLYTLLVSAMVAASAFAGIPTDKQQICTGFKPGAEMKLKAAFNELQTPNFATQTPAGMQRAVQDGQGNEWSMLMRPMGALVDNFGFEGDPTFDDFPMYLMIMATESETSFFPAYLNWPCKAMINDDCYTGNDLDWDKAATIYGSKEEAQKMATVNEVRAAQNNYIFALGGFYYQACIIPAAYTSTVTYNGTENLYFKACTISNGQISLDGSYIEWTSFDPDFNEIETTFNWVVGPTASQDHGSITGTGTKATYVLTGIPTILGMSDLTMEGLQEVHVFDTGLCDYDSEFGMSYEKEFTPVQRFFVVWCDPTMSYMVEDKEGNTLYGWNDEYTNGDLTKMRIWVVNPEYNHAYFQGAFFAPAGTSELKGIWSMPKPDFTVENHAIAAWNSVPEAYKMVPWGYNYGISDQDGIKGVWGGYGAAPGEELSFVGFGDKEYGFNFKFSVDGWDGHTISGYCATPLIYHLDSSNWNQMTQVAAIAGADANVITGDSGVDAVEDASPVVATEYYNLQGVRVAAPQQGIFIQRNIKANGSVSTVKVAK